MDKAKSISFFLVLSALIVGACKLLESDYLVTYLKENLITILIALLAINTTTGSVVMTKLQEIALTKGINFSSTIHELKVSVIEQVIYIIASLLILICMDSDSIIQLYHPVVATALEISLISVFLASLHNLYDTANSIFIILEYEGKQ